MKEYRVMFYRNDDGGEDFMEFEDMEQAQAFYDSLGGAATIQRWFDEFHAYVDICYPTFEC